MHPKGGAGARRIAFNERSSCFSLIRACARARFLGTEMLGHQRESELKAKIIGGKGPLCTAPYLPWAPRAGNALGVGGRLARVVCLPIHGIDLQPRFFFSYSRGVSRRSRPKASRCGRQVEPG